jgi:hypothetical protein
MDNPLKLARPTDPIQQIHEYARDLAYLFATGNIGPTISIGGRFSWSDSPYIERDHDSQDRIDFRAKWVAKSDENFSPPAFESRGCCRLIVPSQSAAEGSQELPGA